MPKHVRGWLEENEAGRGVKPRGKTNQNMVPEPQNEAQKTTEKQ